jgi:hypothetical protein
MKDISKAEKWSIRAKHIISAVIHAKDNSGNIRKNILKKRIRLSINILINRN